MRGVWLPGERRVEVREVADPVPGHGQVVLAPRASTICGSDLRAIYREHLGTGPEAYQDVIAGHEPCGEVVDVGPGCRQVRPGDRVVVYHISGCGRCAECRKGYPISCTSPLRAAYGWQRDGGHADLMLAEEADLLPLPEPLSYLDGACVACGFATAYEALRRIEVSGSDTVLVTGLGPVGLAAGLLARALGASTVVGSDPDPARRELALQLGAVSDAVDGDDTAIAQALPDGASAAVDCSGSGLGEQSTILSLRRWGRCALVGEGGRLRIDVSEQLIHRQVSLVGSWVSSVWRMAELLDNLARWGLHPERVVTDRFELASAAKAYELADAGHGGKVGIVMDGTGVA